MGVSVFLVLLALVLTIIAFFSTRAPFLTIAVLLLCVAGLASAAGTIHLGLAP